MFHVCMEVLAKQGDRKSRTYQVGSASTVEIERA